MEWICPKFKGDETPTADGFTADKKISKIFSIYESGFRNVMEKEKWWNG